MPQLRAFREGLQAMRRAPLIQLITIGAVAVALLFLGALRLSRQSLGRFAEGLGQGVQVVVYLEDGIALERAQQLTEALGKLPGVARAQRIDAREAKTRLRKSLGDRGQLLDGIDDSLLPTSIELTLHDGARDTQRLLPAIERIRRMPGVEDVEHMGEWVERLLALEQLLALVGSIAAALVGAACLFIIGSSIRLGIHGRRTEIEILKLCGATDSFVRAPFLVEGALQGILGSGLALGLLYGLYRLLVPTVEAALGALLAAAPLHFLSLTEVVATLGIGGLIGVAASYVAVGRYVGV